MRGCACTKTASITLFKHHAERDMGWYGPSGDCGCCGSTVCEDCEVITYFTISIGDPICPGTADPDPGFCSRNDGTYVFRTTGTAVGNCTWVESLDSGQCFNDPGEPYFYWYIGFVATSSGGCGGSGDKVSIDFTAVTGGVRVRVIIERDYWHQTGDSPIVTNSGGYTFTFEDTFETCADAIGATLPYVGVSTTNCTGTAPGDYCDVASAVVTVG